MALANTGQNVTGARFESVWSLKSGRPFKRRYGNLTSFQWYHLEKSLCVVSRRRELDIHSG